jgi:hypothetical protein
MAQYFLKVVISRKAVYDPINRHVTKKSVEDKKRRG